MESHSGSHWWHMPVCLKPHKLVARSKKTIKVKSSNLVGFLLHLLKICHISSQMFKFLAVLFFFFKKCAGKERTVKLVLVFSKNTCSSYNGKKS